MIVINGTQLGNHFLMPSYDFQLNKMVEIVSYKLQASSNWITINKESAVRRNNNLFELNYLVFNTDQESDFDLSALIKKIESSGVTVSNQPNHDDLRVMYKPIGDLSNRVRFYITNSCDIVFLSECVKMSYVRQL